RSDEQRNLYKALVEAYDADKADLPQGLNPDNCLPTTCQMGEPSHLVFETGANDQPIVQTSQHPEWFSQPKRPSSSDRDWNKTLPAAQGDAQSWISVLARQTDACSSFNELLDTPIDFFNFIMNRLNVDTLTPALLAGPTYELMKGHESALDVYSKKRIIAITELKIVEWHNYMHLDWISRRVEDLQLGVESYQKRLNLTKPDMYRPDLKRREAYTAYSNLRGFEKSEKLGRVPTEMELILEHTQQGISYEVSVSTEGVEELKRNDKIKGVKKEALLIHLGRNRVNTYAIKNTKMLFGIEDSRHVTQ
nr:hypothetical protein [Tanacetum cinerariifolium]